MFTGIIEAMATVSNIEISAQNKIFTLQSELGSSFKVDQSVCHNGCCLTVTDILPDNHYKVCAIDETLKKTNLNDWVVGDRINLERSLQVHSRLDGHWLQGHVDQKGICTAISDEGGSWKFTFSYDYDLFQNLTIEKGSIAINGVSLTVVNSKKNEFSVAIIPYTYFHTHFQTLSVNQEVNLEFDVLGKYIKKLMGNSGLKNY